MHHSRSLTLRRAFTLVELLVVIAIIGILVGLLMPAIQSARESSRRMSCSNNLHQIGLAIHNYDSTFRTFPVGSIQSNFISGFASILPYVDQTNIYQHYNFSLYYTHPHNQAVSKQLISTYLCPSMPLPRVVPEPVGGEVGAPSSYLLSEGTRDYMRESDGIFGLAWPGFGFANRHLSFRDVYDGASSTIAVGETTYNFKDYVWPASAGPLAGKPRYGTARWIVGYPRVSMGTTFYPFNVHRMPNIGGFTSMHRGGAQFVFVDASVRMVSNHIHRDVLNAMATREAGEVFEDESVR